MSITDLLVYLAILVIFCLVLWYLLTQLNLPPPAGQIISILIVVIAAIIVIAILLSFTHSGALKLGFIQPAIALAIAG